MKNSRIMTLTLGMALVAGSTSVLAQGQAFDPPTNGQYLNPGPVPTDSARLLAAGYEATSPTPGLLNPPVKWGNQDDRVFARIHDRRLQPGETRYTPDGTNEPVAIPEDVIAPQALPLFQEFDGAGINGWTPADPDLGVGAGYVVQVVNDDILVYDKCGSLVFSRDANDFFGFDTTYQFYDPKIFYDQWNGKWTMLWHVKRESDQFGRLFLAVTNTNQPFGVGSWYFYQFNFVQDAGTANASFPDYYDIGYSDDHVYVGGDQFAFSGGFRWSRMSIWRKSEIYNAATAFTANHFNFNNPDGTAMRLPRAIKQQRAFGNADGYFINSRRTGGSRLTKWVITDPFGANTRTGTDIDVAAYDLPLDAQQPSGALLDVIDNRLMIAVQGGSSAAGTTTIFTGLNDAQLWGGDTVNRTACRLFAINGSTNAVLFDRNFGAGSQYYWFPSVAADYNNNAVWVFTRSGAALSAEARFVEWENGVFPNTATTFRTGSGSYGGTRWGDYFGGQIDWDDYNNAATDQTRLWVTGMFAIPGSWGTSIAATSFQTKGNLAVTAGNFVASGPQGGPFTPATDNWTLTNSGQTGLRFTVSESAAWLDVNVDAGELYDAPASRLVTASFTANANTLAPGVYNTNITFADCSINGNSIVRTAQLTVRPRNDTCATATTIGLGSTQGTTDTALNENGDVTTCGTNDIRDVYYRYVATCDGFLTVSTCSIFTNFDTTLAAYGSCTGRQIVCNDNDLACAFNTTRSRIRFQVAAGADYYIRVAGANNTVGDFNLSLSFTNCPADYNNDCSVDFFDYLDFVQDFATEAPNSDFNNDGTIDFFDYLDFVQAFDGGC